MGRLKVDHDRWREAQAWEEKVWVTAARRSGWRRAAWWVAGPVVRLLNLPIGEGSDWNQWWAAHFNDYAFLPKDLENYIELGCGPFTNTRKVLEGRRAAHVFCSDPLVKTYVGFRDRWLAKRYREAKLFVDDHPIEECPFASNYFDCVVMTNVLDHVRDADLCMEQAIRIVKPGGLLIIGQDLTSREDADSRPFDPAHDIGHPILLSREDMDKHFGNFRTLHRKDLKREEGREPDRHYSTLIWAGQKIDPTP